MSEKTDPGRLPSTSAPTRRQVIAGGAIALGGLALGADVIRAASSQTKSESKSKEEISTSESIHEEIDFTASPRHIYETLLDSREFSAISGGAATEIHREEGGTFSCFGGHIVGRILEMVPNQRIVQAWRVVTWPEGDYSIARFVLSENGAGTRLIFDHRGFPNGLKEHLAEGWHLHYWEPLKKLT